MGQRGPAPAPVALRILKGEDHKARLERAPQPQDPPAKPEDLAPAAAKVWDRILGVADHIGERHADTFRHYCEVTAAMAAIPALLKGSKDWRELANVHRQLARELCLTPATGGGLQAKKEPERKLAKYIAG